VVVVVVGAGAVVVVVGAAAVVGVVLVGGAVVVVVDRMGVVVVADPLHFRLADVLDLTTMSFVPEHVTLAESPIPSDTELVAAAATP
jgi:hypothetical protein